MNVPAKVKSRLLGDYGNGVGTLIVGLFEDAIGSAGGSVTAVQTATFVSNATNVGFFGATPRAQWAQIAGPTGGATQDAEARAAILSILEMLEAFGLTNS